MCLCIVPCFFMFSMGSNTRDKEVVNFSVNTMSHKTETKPKSHFISDVAYNVCKLIVDRLSALLQAA